MECHLPDCLTVLHESRADRGEVLPLEGGKEQESSQAITGEFEVAPACHLVHGEEEYDSLVCGNTVGFLFLTGEPPARGLYTGKFWRVASDLTDPDLSEGHDAENRTGTASTGSLGAERVRVCGHCEPGDIPPNVSHTVILGYFGKPGPYPGSAGQQSHFDFFSAASAQAVSPKVNFAFKVRVAAPGWVSFH